MFWLARRIENETWAYVQGSVTRWVVLRNRVERDKGGVLTGIIEEKISRL